MRRTTARREERAEPQTQCASGAHRDASDAEGEKNEPEATGTWTGICEPCGIRYRDPAGWPIPRGISTHEPQCGSSRD